MKFVLPAVGIIAVFAVLGTIIDKDKKEVAAHKLETEELRRATETAAQGSDPGGQRGIDRGAVDRESSRQHPSARRHRDVR